MDPNENKLNWFEIPVSNMERAKKFYEVLFGIDMHENINPSAHMVFFPDNMTGKISGALVKSDMHKPGDGGPVIYFNANPDLTNYLIKVEMAGGKIAKPKTHVSQETGSIAFFFDTEGNRIGLHSIN